MWLDSGFDFRSDTPAGGDPDSHSPTLHRYHQRLWSKPLPSGRLFDLVDGRPENYLIHRSELGEFFLSSDAVIATFRKKPVASQVPAEDLASFNATGYTIGGMMLFPGNRVEGKVTINGARGFHPRIADRFDLTLECIRRHYAGDDSPLAETLTRYADFFRLFETFHVYVEFFLLQDLLTADGRDVAFFLAFDDFDTPAVPASPDEYQVFRRRSVDFVHARNRRIDAWVGAQETDAAN